MLSLIRARRGSLVRGGEVVGRCRSGQSMLRIGDWTEKGGISDWGKGSEREGEGLGFREN